MLPLRTEGVAESATRARINQLRAARGHGVGPVGRLARADFPSRLTFFHARTAASLRCSLDENFSNRGEERAVGIDETVGHAGRVEGEAGIPVFVEQNEAAGALATIREQLDSGLRGARGRGVCGAQKITSGLGHDDFHDGFTVAGGGNSAGFPVGVAATTDERRIADAAGKFAARAAGGSRGKQASLLVESDGPDGALLVAAMMLGGVGILSAAFPGFPLGGRNELFGIAEGDVMLHSEALGACGDEHHVRRVLEDGAGNTNGILDVAQSRDGTGAKRGRVHDDRVAFDLAVKIQVGTITGVEDGIIFEDDDGGFDGVESVAAVDQHAPTSAKSAEAAGIAGFNGFIGNVPGTAVDNERGSHEEGEG